MDAEIEGSTYCRVNLYNGINLAFLDCANDTTEDVKFKGTFLLLHGFPETCYQWRAVIPQLTKRGYRVLAPDYRGAGESSKPNNGFTKASMAADIIMLLDHKEIDEPVHVVGHDIGGIIAFTLASRWPERVATLCMSECILPGTRTFNEECQGNAVDFFHFIFHCVDNLPEALIVGREKTYIEHFVNKQCFRLGAVSPRAMQVYARAYSQPGAIRCMLDLFRSFEKDAEDLLEWINTHGRSTTKTLVLCGQHSSYKDFAEKMALEVTADQYCRSEIINDSGHFVAEENPGGVVEALVGLVER